MATAGVPDLSGGLLDGHAHLSGVKATVTHTCAQLHIMNTRADKSRTCMCPVLLRGFVRGVGSSVLCKAGGKAGQVQVLYAGRQWVAHGCEKCFVYVCYLS